MTPWSAFSYVRRMHMEHENGKDEDRSSVEVDELIKVEQMFEKNGNNSEKGTLKMLELFRKVVIVYELDAFDGHKHRGREEREEDAEAGSIL